MTLVLSMNVALLWGVGVALAWLGLLWLTLRRLPSAGAASLAASGLLRVLLVSAALLVPLWFGDAWHALASAASFLLARTLVAGLVDAAAGRRRTHRASWP